MVHGSSLTVMAIRNKNRNTPNRGRIQAQGDKVEKSRSWAEVYVPTKQKGHGFIDNLKGQLKPAELAVRLDCIRKAKKWVDSAPKNGYTAVTPIKTSFPPCPPIKDIRVDGEIYSGSAFKDDGQ